jgi:hypothetical protein
MGGRQLDTLASFVSLFFLFALWCVAAKVCGPPCQSASSYHIVTVPRCFSLSLSLSLPWSFTLCLQLAVSPLLLPLSSRLVTFPSSRSRDGLFPKLLRRFGVA